MLLTQFRKMVSDTVYQRGIQYFRDGRIRKYQAWQVNEDYWQISAIVEGTEKYQVRTRIGVIRGELDLESYCECPYDREEYCKHSVAVVYRFFNGEYRENPRDRELGGTAQAPSQPSLRTGNEFDSWQLKLQRITAPPLQLRYKIHGLAKLSLANFRLSFDSATADQAVTRRIFDYALDTAYRPSYFKLNETLQQLNCLSSFDRMVLEHLRVVQTRKDTERRAVFIAKTPENFSFILTILQNREIILDENGLLLVAGEPIKPKGYLQGDIAKARLRFTMDDLETLGVYCPELNYLLAENRLHPVDTVAAENLPAEMEIPPSRQGEFLFEVLPRLRESLPLEVESAFAKHTLRTVTPQIRLHLDFQDEQVRCFLEIQIEQGVYQGWEALKIINNPLYTPPQTGNAAEASSDSEWLTVDKTALQELEAFFNEFDFVVSTEGIVLKDPDALIRFLLAGTAHLPPHWLVTTSDAYEAFRVTPVSLEPVAELNPDADIDWFEFKVYYNLGGQTYSHQEISKMLRRSAQGDRYIRIGQQIFLLERGERVDLIEKAVASTEQGFKEQPQEFYNLFFLRSLFLDHGVKIIGNQVYNELEKDLTRQNLVEAAPLPAGLQGELRQYQQEGFYWLSFLQKYRLGGILADDMGLGKTIQVLTLIKSLSGMRPQEAPVLVVCPRSLLYNWAAEIDKFYPGTPYLVYHGSPEERERMRRTFSDWEIIITTYDLIHRDEKAWHGYQFFYCILDEAQHIKNHQTKRSQLIKRIRARHRLVMTGTPIENSLDELWSIFDFLMPGYLGNKQKFTSQFVVPITREGRAEVLLQLKQKVAPFILRRRKDEVLAELPEKMIMVQKVFMTKLQEDTYRTVLDQARQDVLQAISRQGWEKSQITILAALTKMRQICDHPRLVLPDLALDAESGKIEALLELTSEAIGAGHKLVIFSQFVKMLRIIEEKFKAAEIRYEYLDGSTRDRMERINRFNQTPQISAFLISLKAGGVGINLTAADIVIHVDPWWNPMVENQATDRVHRIGQRNQVMVYKLITTGTVEEKMLQLQNLKKSVFDAVIERNENPVTKLTWDDIKGMFDL